MANKHRFAGLIWAAILMIAVQFLPNAAIAHSGHQHVATSQHGVTVQDVLSPQAISAHHDVEDVSKTTERESEPAAPIESDWASQPSSGCVGGCCGSGLGCCSAAALAGSGQVLPLFDARAEIIAFASDWSGGIDPEALARPPKALA